MFCAMHSCLRLLNLSINGHLVFALFQFLCYHKNRNFFQRMSRDNFFCHFLVHAIQVRCAAIIFWKHTFSESLQFCQNPKLRLFYYFFSSRHFLRTSSRKCSLVKESLRILERETHMHVQQKFSNTWATWVWNS